jgi:hypothetical protein
MGDGGGVDVDDLEHPVALASKMRSTGSLTANPPL